VRGVERALRSGEGENRDEMLQRNEQRVRAATGETSETRERERDACTTRRSRRGEGMSERRRRYETERDDERNERERGKSWLV